MAANEHVEHEPPLVFFCHVMKTGGTSLRVMLLESGIVRPEQMAPHIPGGRFEELLPFYVMNPFAMRDRIPSEFGGVRIVCGHYPFLTHTLCPPSVVTASLFRDPVERAISHIKHLQRQKYPNKSYEEIYDDRKVFDSFLYNLQARAFVFEDPTANSLMERTFDWNEDFLERAKQNVERCDVIGLTDRFPAFVGLLSKKLGWKFKRTARLHAAPRWQAPFPDALRTRMREDLVYDIRFYEYVKRIHFQREIEAVKKTT